MRLIVCTRVLTRLCVCVWGGGGGACVSACDEINARTSMKTAWIYQKHPPFNLALFC